MAEQIITEAILSFASNVFMKGGEELGKNVAKDLYDKLKQLFRKEDQRVILSNLKNAPDQLQARDELNKAMIDLLAKNESFPKEVVGIFELMNVDVAILQVTYSTYVYVRYQNEQEHIKFGRSSADSEDDCLRRINGYERKMRSLSDKIKELVAGNQHPSGVRR
jgi:hypothetical protein